MIRQLIASQAVFISAVTLLLLGATPAHSAPIVQQGSTYFQRLFDPGVFGLSVEGVVFDGLDEVRTVDGRTLTLGESQSDLGNGVWEIRLSLVSDTDLAPADGIFSRFGHGDPLDLLESVYLVSLVQTWTGFDPNGSAFSWSGDVASVLSDANRSPWNGSFADPGVGVGYFGIQGYDFRSVSYVATVQRIPLPSTALLGALALLAMGIRQRPSPR